MSTPRRKFTQAQSEELSQKVKLLTKELQDILDRNQLLHNDNAIMRVRTEKFDEILNKIERASYGHLIYQAQQGAALAGANYGSNYAEINTLMPTLSRSERAEKREADLHHEVEALSNRLTAVSAVVQFAREHKA